MATPVRNGDAPAAVAKAIGSAATAAEPKLRYPAGPLAGRAHVLRRVAPAGAFGKQIRTLFAAVTDLPGASFVGPDGPGERRGNPTLIGRSARASDTDAAVRLWTASEELTGVAFPEQLKAAAGHR